jgi:Ca-activated chloride channel family protein
MMEREIWIPLMGAGIVLTWGIITEWLQSRRIRRMSYLAFGPSGKPYKWTIVAPWIRIICLTAIAWILLSVLLLSNSIKVMDDVPVDTADNAAEQFVLLVDLSPSMSIRDAGIKGEQSRRERTKDIIFSLLDRMGKQVRYTVLCFYTRTIPVVQKAHDKAVVRNVFDELPIEQVMKPGQTDLGLAIGDTLNFIDDYPDKSVTLVICTDGDTLPMKEMIIVPHSVKSTLVLGVGDPQQGTAIDNHLSRQDTITLSRLAGQLHGLYWNVNKKNLPSSEIAELYDVGTLSSARSWSRKELYLMLLALFASVYTFLPLVLQFMGCGWKVVDRDKED